MTFEEVSTLCDWLAEQRNVAHLYPCKEPTSTTKRWIPEGRAACLCAVSLRHMDTQPSFCGIATGRSDHVACGGRGLPTVALPTVRDACRIDMGSDARIRG